MPLKSRSQAGLSLVTAFLCPAAFSHVTVCGSWHSLRPWKYGQSWSAAIIMNILCRQFLENVNFPLLVNSL